MDPAGARAAACADQPLRAWIGWEEARKPMEVGANRWRVGEQKAPCCTSLPSGPPWGCQGGLLGPASDMCPPSGAGGKGRWEGQHHSPTAPWHTLGRWGQGLWVARLPSGFSTDKHTMGEATAKPGSGGRAESGHVRLPRGRPFPRVWGRPRCHSAGLGRATWGTCLPERSC